MRGTRCCARPQRATAAAAAPSPRGSRAASFDHLVGRGEQRLRNVEAERLRGLEIDDD